MNSETSAERIGYFNAKTLLVNEVGLHVGRKSKAPSGKIKSLMAPAAYQTYVNCFRKS